MGRPLKIKKTKRLFNRGDFVRIPSKNNSIGEIILWYWGREYPTNLMGFKYQVQYCAGIKDGDQVWVIETFVQSKLETYQLTDEDIKK